MVCAQISDPIFLNEQETKKNLHKSFDGTNKLKELQIE